MFTYVITIVDDGLQIIKGCKLPAIIIRVHESV